MQDGVRRLALDLRRAEGLDVQIRVGLNSGEVVVAAADGELSRKRWGMAGLVSLAAL